MNDREQTVAVDLDGVLANQVVGVLPRIKEKYGVDLRYDAVVHWRLPIIPTNGRAPTNIADEIVAAQRDREYVLSMPVHEGARRMMDELRERYRVVVLTARSGDALAWSVEWLERHDLPFDDVAGSVEAKKSLHGVDALVDDYLGNVQEFLENTPGPAVLVDQPWNRAERDVLSDYEPTKRLALVTELTQVSQALDKLVSAPAPTATPDGGHRGD
jgi:5'(3')-deoxyribonucleotidase